MVCEWGMSEKLGPVTFGKKEEEIFLGREIAQHRDYSETTAQEIDREVRSIITAAQQKSEKLLNENIDSLHALANALLDYEILDGDQISRILKGEKLAPKRPTEKTEKVPEKSARARKQSRASDKKDKDPKA